MKTTFVHLKLPCNAGTATALTPAREGWSGVPVPAKTLDGFPSGPGVFARVPFRTAAGRDGAARSLLLIEPDDPAERRIAAGAACRAAYLLHTMERGDVGRRPVTWTFEYEDGTTAERTLTVGVDLADWLFPRETAGCRIGWTGFLKANEFQKCVYVTELANPHPDRRVAALRVRRGEPFGRYALLGVTLSEKPPFFAAAARGDPAGLADYIHLDDDLLTLEAGVLRLAVSVRRATGAAAPGVRVSAVIAGRRHALAKVPGGHALALPRPRGWRAYANAVAIEARRDGRLLARREAVLYASGRPRRIAPPHGRPPQFLVVAFDDCKVLPGVESLLEIVETLAARGARAPLTLYVSPCEPRSPDIERVVWIYRRLFALGCEFCNHTLNHNPGGVNWYALPHDGQEREITGCRQWLRDRIPGLWHVFSQKTGGGGARGFRDPAFSRALIRRQRFEYNANNVTAFYDTNLPHPDVQCWPYRLGPEWSIDISAIDANAPPVHRPITRGFYTDYSGKFDRPVADGVAMLMANLDYRYRSPHRPPMIINAMHEWGLGNYNPSHRNQKAILQGFLLEALVRRRRDYPDTHMITLHQLVEYARHGDLAAVLAAGNGQGR